ncbi:MAG: peptide chain release factor 1 [Smithellaceae bacterium]|jgi:peptide chain release factor 1|nr:peptide chain release factor 1 [Smithellaceae bacterium]MDD3258416.1 peptide chain release factor 1 [Smithellaceae bacterium]MDD3849699.1 peptide chain release factor 1 [Smithellaceae bacterium]HOQ72649.1 peptide chain release factor 1 [Smithellaceae bacterium]HPL09272.1 peptide chain release factor 1 [Smithellaceae bacterium]
MGILLNKLHDIELRYRELEGMLSDAQMASRQGLYQKYAKEHSDLSELVETIRRYEKIRTDLAENQGLLADSDEEVKALAKEEIPQLQQELAELEEKIKILLLPKDPNDDKNVFLEIRAGTGGDEAGLFVGDLFRMYARYAESQGWKVEIVSSSPAGGMGGFKEIIAQIEGRGAYSRLKYESGTHRVQRVPVTEAQGRIHTSAVTVAIMPEAEEVEVNIDPNELRIDVYRSTGHGGQSVNTTDSAVRITHIPTGLVVTCQDEKSQLKNKAKALKVLRSRLLDAMVQKQNAEQAQVRKNQVGSGDRSERIRTYNFPQGRITDHRINLTRYDLDSFINGNIGAVIDALASHHQAELLNKEGKGDTLKKLSF